MKTMEKLADANGMQSGLIALHTFASTHGDTTYNSQALATVTRDGAVVLVSSRKDSNALKGKLSVPDSEKLRSALGEEVQVVVYCINGDNVNSLRAALETQRGPENKQVSGSGICPIKDRQAAPQEQRSIARVGSQRQNQT